MHTSLGWVKLHRCLLDDAVCQKSAYFHLWVTLLLMATHKEHEFIFNNKIQSLKPGQLITGRKKLSTLTRIPQTTIERILNCLESGHMIGQQKFRKFRIITITKWDNFQSEQSSGPLTGQQTDSWRTTSGQYADTYKNVKNDKNEKTHACDDLSKEGLEIQPAHEANNEALARWLAEDD